MKTDKEVIREMLERAGIEFDYYEKDEEFHVDGGYIGFFTAISFNEDGSLKSIGAYE